MSKIKQRKSSITVQFDPYQVKNLDSIIELEALSSYSVLVRKAFDYYVQAEYPQLIPQTN